MTWRNLGLASAGVLLLISGVVHGLWTGRWQESPEVADFVARLDRVPRDIGSWHGTDKELTQDELRVARIDGYCYRQYVNSLNQHSVTMLLVCGRAGPITVHTPDICFEGAGLKAAATHAPFSLTYGSADDEAEATFRTMRFSREEAETLTEIRVFWTWNSGKAWRAPDNPRMAFAGPRALYKMYVIRTKTGDDVAPKDDPCAQFLKEFLPEMDAILQTDP